MTTAQYKTPKEALDFVRQVGKARAKQPMDQILVLSFASGVYIGFGAYCALLVGGNVPGIKKDNPGLQKLLYGIAFTVGLMMTTLTGSDLFTGNVFTISFALFSKKSRAMNIVHAIKSVIITFIGNLLGGLFVAYFFVYLLTTEYSEPWIDFLKTMAVKKTHKNVGLLFLSGIGCNWVVSTAVFMLYTAEDISGRILAMFFPVAAFAIFGFEHVVANAFFLPCAAMFGADTPVWRIIFWNYLPVALGNYVGGAICVGVVFWYAHMFRPKHHNAIENTVKAVYRRVRRKNVNSNSSSVDQNSSINNSSADFLMKNHGDVAVMISSTPPTSATTTTTTTENTSDSYSIEIEPGNKLSISANEIDGITNAVNDAKLFSESP